MPNTLIASYDYGLEVHKGLIATGEYAVVIKPKFWRADGTMPAMIYAPALSGGGWNMMGWFLSFELAKRGFACVSSDLGDTPSQFQGAGLSPSVGGAGGNTGGPGVWGNDSSMTKMTSVYNFTQNVLKARTQVVITGGSHGGATAPRWVASNNDKVACMLLGIGAVDIQDILTNNRGVNAAAPSGYAQSVQTAWGLGSGTTLPAGSTGVQCAPNITVPVMDYYSTDDPICVASTHTAFAAANPTHITAQSFGSVSHSLNNFPITAAADWIMSNIS